MPRYGQIFTIAILTLAPVLARAQTPQQIVQQVVDSERAANKNDRSQWIYLDTSTKPKEHITEWVATTQRANVDRVLVENGHTLSPGEQQSEMEKFLHDPRAQNKQMEENQHDAQQVDDLLRLLPTGFLWSVTRVTPTETTLHFKPNPAFHPPNREARVFAAAAGNLIADNRQHRIRVVSGTLVHDVAFGGGLLGRLKQGGSFSIEQQQVGPALWQLTGIRIHLDGSALVFKSISFQQDEERSRFSRQPDNVTLVQAEQNALTQPANPQAQVASPAAQ